MEPDPLKWTYLYRLADGRSTWHEDVWLPGLVEVDGVTRVVVHEARQAPQPEDVKRPLNHWSGIAEVHLADGSVMKNLLPAARAAVADGFTDLRGMLSTVQEEYDLRRDVPAQQYPFISESITWHSEPPTAGEPDDGDLWRYVYFFRYRDDVPWSDGESWYLGHHTREGRQLPGLRRYLTWRRRQDPFIEGEDVHLFNGFARYTELSFESFEAWHAAPHEKGPKWRMDERYPSGVWTDYQQLFIGTVPSFDIAR